MTPCAKCGGQTTPAGTGLMVVEGELVHVSLRSCDTCKTTEAWRPGSIAELAK